MEEDRIESIQRAIEMMQAEHLPIFQKIYNQSKNQLMRDTAKACYHIYVGYLEVLQVAAHKGKFSAVLTGIVGSIGGTLLGLREYLSAVHEASMPDLDIPRAFLEWGNEDDNSSGKGSLLKR